MIPPGRDLPYGWGMDDAPPRFLVDADACPVREEILRVAARLGLPVALVTNGSRPIRPPAQPQARLVVVSEGADKADDWIAEEARPVDVCITADIPLAAAVVAKDAHALSPRGELYGRENIRELLDLRNFMDTLRATGVDTGGPSAFSAADARSFANRLDVLLRRNMKPSTGKA